MSVEPDRVLFLGDCLYASTGAVEKLTAELAFPLEEAVRSFGAELYVQGHAETVVPRSEALPLLDEMRVAGTLVQELAAEGGTLDESAALGAATKRLGEEPSEDTAWFISAFVAGLAQSPGSGRGV